ncbi:nucleotidyltransferase family protein [Methanoculleus bourgensis]|uniref:nucleotidyltransferase family protein n=1 Tax=Methanoculleus bourgensis TaxID=83986 RepID=UPI004046C618
MAGRTLTRAARETIVAILTRNDAEWIAIFGSYARGSANATSNIDILVRFARKKKPFFACPDRGRACPGSSYEGGPRHRERRESVPCRCNPP